MIQLAGPTVERSSSKSTCFDRCHIIGGSTLDVESFVLPLLRNRRADFGGVQTNSLQRGGRIGYGSRHEGCGVGSPTCLLRFHVGSPWAQPPKSCCETTCGELPGRHGIVSCQDNSQITAANYVRHGLDLQCRQWGNAVARCRPWTIHSHEGVLRDRSQ